MLTSPQLMVYKISQHQIVKESKFQKTTFKILISQCLCKQEPLLSKGKLTSLVISSSTIRFCFGTRPVLEPEEMQRAPVSVILLGPTDSSGDHIWSGNIAYSYNSATLQSIVCNSKQNFKHLRWIKDNSVGLFIDTKLL